MRSATARQTHAEWREPASGEIFYPSSDGEPLAEDTRQYNFIERTKGNLDASLDSFVAADLLWYPVQGRPDISVGPDVMVALGRPKGQRSSYRQWDEDDIPPQVVFEYWSPSNNLAQFARKFAFYEQHGVDEFYVYDEERRYLGGWVRRGDRFTEITNLDGWVSPALGVRFEWRDGDLTMFRPDGSRFLSFDELDHAKRDAERARADAEAARADAERARADAEQRASAAEARAEAMAARLRELGIEP